jgi:hypothetical protein
MDSSVINISLKPSDKKKVKRNNIIESNSQDNIHHAISTRTNTLNNNDGSKINTCDDGDSSNKNIDELMALSFLVNLTKDGKHDGNQANLSSILLKSMMNELTKSLILNMIRDINIKKIIKQAFKSQIERRENENPIAEKKYENFDNKPSNETPSEQQNCIRARKVNVCPHKDRPHYAKVFIKY